MGAPIMRKRGARRQPGRHGKPLVRITRLESSKRPIRFGLLEGRLSIPADFDAPLPDDVLARFEGR